MKQIILLLSMLFRGVAFAHNIEWYVVDTLLSTTTCESGDNITPPTPPAKHGYHFKNWLEYTPIEYLEATGTQWIDTGITLNANLKFELDSALISTQNGENVFGVAGARVPQLHSIRAGGSYNYFTIFRNDIEYTPCNISIDTKRHLIMSDIYNNVIQLDDCRVNLSSPYPVNTTGYKIYIGARSEFGNVRLDTGWRAKYYNVKFYDADILVRDFVPALDENGTPCMYDKVEHKFYYNQGTGQFIAGSITDE